MITQLFAHAGEAHGNEVVARAHELAWYVQLPLFVLCLAMFASVVWLITKKVDATLLVSSFAMLVAGFALFQIAPLVSVAAITVGLITTLGVTLLGLGAGDSA